MQVPSKPASGYWKIAISGVPSAGKTTVLSVLQEKARQSGARDTTPLCFYYNTGRDIIKRLSPSYGPNSFLRMLRERDTEKMRRFVTQLMKCKQKELDSDSAVFTEKTLADYLILLPMICKTFPDHRQWHQKAELQASKYDFIFVLPAPKNDDEFVRIHGRPRMDLPDLWLLHRNLLDFFRQNARKVVEIPDYSSIEETVEHVISKLPTDLRRLFLRRSINS